MAQSTRNLPLNTLVIVPLVSLFTKCDTFDVQPPSRLGAGDREFAKSLEGEGGLENLSDATDGKGIEGAAADTVAVRSSASTPKEKL